MALKKQDLIDLFAGNTKDMTPAAKASILKVTGRGGQSASRDYISANCLLAEVKKANPTVDLSKVSSEKELMDMLPAPVRFRLKNYTPCLARRYDDALKPAEQNALFEDPNWVATEKMNGCRGWLIVYHDKVYLFSRNYSDVDCSLLEYWSNVDQIVKPIDNVYAIDVEIMFEPGADISDALEHLGLATDSPLEAMVAMLHTYPESACEIQRKFRELYGKDLISFRLIAPLYFRGKNYLIRTLGEGMDVYNDCVEFGKSIGLNVRPIARCNGSRTEKEVFLDTILNNGGEGVVFHNRKGMYNTSENRSKTSYVKLKRSVGTSKNGLDDQIDAFVTGYKVGTNGTVNEGLISALAMSIYVNDNGRLYEHCIAMVPNIDLETKKLCTLHDASGLYPQEITLSDGSTTWVSLNPEFDHLVGEVDGQALSAVSQRLEHPRLLRWVVERSPESCIYTKEWLNANTTASAHNEGKIAYQAQNAD